MKEISSDCELWYLDRCNMTHLSLVLEKISSDDEQKKQSDIPGVHLLPYLNVFTVKVTESSSSYASYDAIVFVNGIVQCLVSTVR